MAEANFCGACGSSLKSPGGVPAPANNSNNADNPHEVLARPALPPLRLEPADVYVNAFLELAASAFEVHALMHV